MRIVSIVCYKNTFTYIYYMKIHSRSRASGERETEDGREREGYTLA